MIPSQSPKMLYAVPCRKVLPSLMASHCHDHDHRIPPHHADRLIASDSLPSTVPLHGSLRRDGGEALLKRTVVHPHQPHVPHKRTCKHAPRVRSGAPTSSRGRTSAQRTPRRTARTQTRRPARRPPPRCPSSRPRGARCARGPPGPSTKRWNTHAPTRGCC